MAANDPARANRLTGESQRYFDHPQAYLFLANGLKTRDPAAAHQAFQTAVQGIDRLMKEDSLILEPREIVLPLVEQVDPALVPEYFWRVVATRPPIGNPRAVSEFPSPPLIALLAWYDHEVAAALFEPVQDWIEHADDQELDRRVAVFQAWSIFDPRAAVARLAQVPLSSGRDRGADSARQQVAEMLGLPHEARWRTIFGQFTELRQLQYPALW